MNGVAGLTLDAAEGINIESRRLVCNKEEADIRSAMTTDGYGIPGTS